MSTRHADRQLSIYPIIGLAFATMTVRADVMYTHVPQPRYDQQRPNIELTPRRWCVHWALSAGSWQTGGNLCEPIERFWKYLKGRR